MALFVNFADDLFYVFYHSINSCTLLSLQFLQSTLCILSNPFATEGDTEKMEKVFCY